MRYAIVALFTFIATSLAAADEPQLRPATRDCVRSLETGELLPKLQLLDGAEPRGQSAIGTPYDVTHGVGTQNPTPGCFTAYAPGPPFPPDDIVTFDGVPEQTRQLINNAIPVVNEQEIPLGLNQFQLSIQSQSSPSTPLFPGGLIGPQGQPLTDGCYFIGLTTPLNYAGNKTVTHADMTLTVNGTPFAPTFDVTPFFSNPWTGTFGVRIPGIAGSPVNGVVVNIFVNLGGGCVTDSDCDDGDPCTLDICLGDGSCVYASIICNDGDECTVDSCEPGVGCVFKHLKDVLTREQALRASHGPSAPCFESGGVPCPPPTLTEPDDGWKTNDNCDGETKWRIGLDAGSPALPADFFDPGSEPFTGEIIMKGLSLNLPNQADTDTVVRRSAEPFSRSSPADGSEVTVDIELVALSLVSCQPITVTYNNGNPSTEWNVVVTLSDCPPAPGTLTAKKTHCNGGTFESILPVQPKVTFTRVDNPLTTRVFDTGCDSPTFPADVLTPPVPSAWVHDIANNLAVAANYASSFHAGFPEGQSTSCGDFDLDNDADASDFREFLRGYGSDTTGPGCLYYLDYDADGDIDYSDYQEWLACHRCSIGNPLAGPPAPAGLIGDFTGDGRVRGDDAQAYVDCVTLGNPASPPCDRADINQDGVFNERDVPGFVLLLLEVN